MTTATLPVIEFGRQLVETGDLDPVYIAVQGAGFSKRKLQEWLLAYWCYYHCGTASWIVDQPGYWTAMYQAACSSDYPRGTERRHFRGELSRKSVAWLRDYPGGFGHLMGAFDEGVQPKSLESVMNYVQTWVGFGPWIAFKVADMLERLGLCQVNFSAADTFLFKSPAEGAELVYERYFPYKDTHTIHPSQRPSWALDYLQRHLGTLKAPPRYERTLNGQEYETILCKWKSHLSGHYPVGKDVHEIWEGLLRFSGSRTAQQLLRSIKDLYHA